MDACEKLPISRVQLVLDWEQILSIKILMVKGKNSSGLDLKQIYGAIQGLTTLMIVIVGSREPIRSIQNL